MKTLVIFLGNARGGEDTWQCAYRNLLEPYEADLALCFGVTQDKTASLYSKARYLWELPEYDDWSTYFEQHFNGSWRKSFELGIGTGLAGGLDKSYSGSGAIGIAFRHHIKHGYADILANYDRIILTRSDMYYFRPHPVLSPELVWIPEGDDYHGIYDRFIIFPAAYADRVLGVADYLDTEEAFRSLRKVYRNPESVEQLYYSHTGIRSMIRRYPRIQFCVAEAGDMTRWAQGQTALPFNSRLLIKYPSEYYLAAKNYINDTFADKDPVIVNDCKAYYARNRFPGILFQPKLFKAVLRNFFAETFKALVKWLPADFLLKSAQRFSSNPKMRELLERSAYQKLP